jgi:hypothetical protein
MIDAARRAEFDYHQRERLLGAERFIPTPDAIIRAMLEAAIAIETRADTPVAASVSGSPAPRIVTAFKPRGRR